MASRKSMFINRELSWLEFNQRVLDEGLDETVPLLDRLSFLSITASNLDEFFMVRVGGLQMLHERGIHKKDASGLTPVDQLKQIEERCRKMVQDQYRCYRELLEPELIRAGIRRVSPDELDAAQRERLLHVFDNLIYPVVSPVAIGVPDPSSVG